MADTLFKSGGIPIMVLHNWYHRFISNSTALSALMALQTNQLNDLEGRAVFNLHGDLTLKL